MGNLLRRAGGVLLLAAALALSLPGVSVQADPPASPSASAPPKRPASDAPMCRANEPIADPAEVARVVEAVRHESARRPDASMRVLNGAGYNYVKGPKVDLQNLERDIRLRRMTGRSGS